MRGKKTPTAIKELKGTAQKCRLPKNEMQPPVVDKVETPTVLKGYAEKEWLKVTAILSELGMLAETDTSLLLAYCIEIGNYFDLKERIGDSITNVAPSGYEIVKPEVTEANKSLQNAIKLADKFGFNPAARTKIEMPVQKPKDAFDELL